MATDAVYVDTSKIRGRRKLRFSSFEDVVEEAQRLQATPHRQLGNWNLSMAVQHLANAINASIDGGTFRVKWYLKLIGPIFIKPVLIKGPFPAGFRLPRSAAARLVSKPDVNFDAALQSFQQAVERFRRERPNNPHPVAGKLNTQQWEQFHLRHAELHMSFLLPESTDA